MRLLGALGFAFKNAAGREWVDLRRPIDSDLYVSPQLARERERPMREASAAFHAERIARTVEGREKYGLTWDGRIKNAQI